ncbi:hypothetical protein [Streptomyces sp. NPDC014006]|uniref:hypothetical protein n=1 Tax=Streptomyces sp. NPDC014006 TaxID=3364870 RepID=UPI0036F99710
MTRAFYCDYATLIVGDRRVPAEVDLGLLLAGEVSRWGGILYRVPAGLVDDARGEAGVRLRLSCGQERHIRLLHVEPGWDEDAECLSVPFLGEGTAPF